MPATRIAALSLLLTRLRLAPLAAALAWVGICGPASLQAATAAPAPLRVLIAGMAHGHVDDFLDKLKPDAMTLVGVYEPNDTTWEKYRSHPNAAHVTRYTDLARALEASHPDAVWAFSDTLDHLPIVRAAAPRGLAVIVEKPLAVSWAAADEMAQLAQRHHTLILTNYETSWYTNFAEINTLLGAEGPLGPLRQIYVQAGHAGPVKINVGPEFLDWLRDPERAGGGALFDFGCYGASLATWWLGNRAPTTVSAHTSQFDPINYPKCDDHAVLQLVYPDVQVTVVGSWHWPYSRKDAAVYGERGSAVTTDKRHYFLRSGTGAAVEQDAALKARDPLQWLAETVRAGRDPAGDPSSLESNLIVMRILEAARRSAATGRAIKLDELVSSPR
ncbi:MAG: oxidoreductase [Verrucomicrobia bacterium]|nr:oxidoreductase [Verrucomicrobiota bacterium]